MAIEFVDLPSYKMVIFHSYVSLPEGICNYHLYSYGHLSVISTYNPIYRMYNSIEITSYNW